MKERLVLERDIIRRLPLQYPFSHQAALAFATERIEGFSEEELENLIDENAIDWLYIEGERRIKDDFVDNLVKTRKDIRARIFDKSALAEGELEGRLRDQTIKRMKEKGGLAYYFRIRSTLKIREAAFEPGKQYVFICRFLWNMHRSGISGFFTHRWSLSGQRRLCGRRGRYVLRLS